MENKCVIIILKYILKPIYYVHWLIYTCTVFDASSSVYQVIFPRSVETILFHRSLVVSDAQCCRRPINNEIVK